MVFLNQTILLFLTFTIIIFNVKICFTNLNIPNKFFHNFVKTFYSVIVCFKNLLYGFAKFCMNN